MSQYNGPIKLPSPEAVDSKIYYTFNLNPSDDFQFTRHAVPSVRLKSFDTSITTMLNQYSNAIYIKANYEISPLGRLHLHGVCRIVDPLLFYFSVAHKLILWSTCEIDTIENMATWEGYCSKLSKWRLGGYESSGSHTKDEEQYFFKTPPIMPLLGDAQPISPITKPKRKEKNNKKI